tara:strand:+ start:721 stop:1218 length:498 start_codon:yes stop_codon:yes gene_type:complete
MYTEVLPRQHRQYTMVVPQTIHSKEVNEMEQIATACERIQHCSSSDARRGEQIPTGIRSSSKPSVGNQSLGVATGWPRSEGVGERSLAPKKPPGRNKVLPQDKQTANKQTATANKQTHLFNNAMEKLEGVKRCEREALLDFHKQSAGADKEDYKSKNSLCTAPRL